MKGIAQSKRDHKWHTNHTRKLALRKLYRLSRVTSYKLYGGNRGVKESTAEANYRKAVEREKATHVGFIDSLKFAWKRAKSRFKNNSPYANA